MGSQLLFDAVWRTWKERQLEDPPAILRRLLALEINPESVQSLAGTLLENRDLALLDAPAPPPSPLNDIWGEVTEAVAKLLSLARYCIAPEDRGLRQIQRLAGVVARTPADELNRERTLLLDLAVASNLGSKGNWATEAACAEQKEICRQLKAMVEAAQTRLGPGLVAGVLDWLKGFLLAVEREKRKRGVLDFQDLLLKARDLVRDHPEVRAWFQQRFRFLLVDEFQDTDPLQAELVFYLGEEEARAQDWREVKLSRDKLFLVGDPKQSIYRFRRADIQIYQQAKRMMAVGGDGQALVIQQNFRSSPAVIEAVNRLFAPQMAGDEYQADYVPLVPAPGRTNPGPGLVLLFPPDGSAPGNMEGYFKSEAELLARCIKRIAHAGDSPLKIWDKRKKETRPPAFGDIAVLFPVTSGLGYYEDVLRACGVPFQVDAGRQFYTRRETRALLSVLAAIDNPEDAIAVAAALRSPFFGLSDADLFLFRHAGGRFHYLRRPPDGFPRMAHCLEQLRRWHRARARLSLSALLDLVLDESCVLQFLLLLPDGEQAVANLLRVVELARRFEAEPGAGTRTFLGWLEQRAAAELAEAETAFADEQEDAVHLLTIHAAKGLEFPVVALASLACNRRRREDVFIDHATRQIGISLKCGDHRLNAANFLGLAEAEQKRGRAEDLRLLYVAATRARDCLVLPRLAPEPAGARTPRFLDFLDGPLSTYGERPEKTRLDNGVLLLRGEDLPAIDWSSSALRHGVGSHAPTDEMVAEILAEREAWRAGLAAIGVVPPEKDGEAGSRGDSEPSASSFGRPGAGPDLAEETRQAGITARVLGSAFHRIMHALELQDERAPELLIERIAAAEGAGQHAAMLKAWVTGTLSSPLWARVRKAGRIWREAPFCIAHEGEVKEGSIDLLFEAGAGGLQNRRGKGGGSAGHDRVASRAAQALRPSRETAHRPAPQGSLALFRAVGYYRSDLKTFCKVLFP
jgi:ATP-dependent helicase/nuclease subunit A